MAQVNEGVIALMSEVLNGTPEGASGTWFVQGNEALLSTLAGLSAEEASRSLGDGINSIAAHVLHMLYYLGLAVDGMNHVKRSADWEGSWAKQVVTESEWEQVRSDCANRFKEFNETLSRYDLSHPDDLTYAIANVGHAGYHLGAIRQQFLLIKSLK